MGLPFRGIVLVIVRLVACINRVTLSACMFVCFCVGVPEVLRLAVEGLRATGVAALVGGSPPGSELKVDMLT